MAVLIKYSVYSPSSEGMEGQCSKTIICIRSDQAFLCLVVSKHATFVLNSKKIAQGGNIYEI